VSTILEALRERDRRGMLGGGESVAWREGRAAIRRRLMGAGVVGLAGVAVGLGLLRWTPQAQEQPSSAAPAPLAGSTTAAPVRPAAPVAPRPLDEPPRARVERWKAVGPATPEPPPEGNAAIPGTAPAQAPAAVGLRLESIRYVSTPAERTVTLRIDGAPAVTLHQGESAGGVDVQLILPEAVYVRQGADVFALGDLR